MRKGVIRKTAWGFLILVVVIFSPYIYSRFASSSNAVSVHSFEAARQSNAAGRALRIGCYNIAHGRGAVPGGSNWKGGDAEVRSQRLRDIGKLLQTLDLDIVVLNEVDFDTLWSGHVDQADVIARAAGFEHVVKQRNIDIMFPFVCFRFGNAILSRHRITEAELVRFNPFSKREDITGGNHDAIFAKIDIPEVGEISVFGVPLEVRSERVRTEAARKILQIVDGSTGPVVVLGDFNSTPSEFPGSEPIEKTGTGLDILRASEKLNAFPPVGNDSSNYTFPSVGADRTIDWILVSRDGRIVDGDVASTELSDHLPVWAEIEF